MGQSSVAAKAICDAFDVEVVSEHEPEYWGHATHEEWDEAWTKIEEEYRAKFHEQVLRHVRGEDHELTPGTIGMIQADIAKVLATDLPDLALPENKGRLVQEMEAGYKRDYEIRVTLTPKDIAIAKMCATHEDDLPKA